MAISAFDWQGSAGDRRPYANLVDHSGVIASYLESDVVAYGSGSCRCGLGELQSVPPWIVGIKTSDTDQCFVPDATDSLLLQ
jgi:hypothetical protein